MVFGTNADFCTRENLVSDIDCGGWIIADLDRRQTRSLPLSRQQVLDFSPYLLLYLIGYSSAFE
jgi:hypothetical protein